MHSQEPANAPPPQPQRMDLDVKDVDIRDVARIFSRVAGLNFVVSDDVQAKVTFSGTNVDWESALNAILKTYNLTYIRDGNFLRILTYARLQQEQNGAPMVNKVVFLDFAKAEDLLRSLDSLRSSRGRINTDVTTNSLVITDTPDTIEKMEAVIKELDKRTPQVMIEALMMDVKIGNQEQMGINWSIASVDHPERLITQALTASRPEMTIRYGKTLLPNSSFYALIDMWCQDKKAEILANPKVLTLDGRTASIELNDEIPYTQSVASSTGETITTTVSFREAGIKLFVTPHISVGGFISLSIKTEQSFQSATVIGQPVIDSRKAETNLLVRDTETIVIGGLRKKDLTSTIDKVPILGDLPLLGKLFQKKVDSFTNTELLIFVTPYIITEPLMTQSEQDNLQRFNGIREKRKDTHLPQEEYFPLRPPK